MEQRGLDQKDIARVLQLSEAYVSRILRGMRPWPVGVLFRLSTTFGVPVSDLDPALRDALIEEILKLELRRDIPHLEVLFTVVEELPRITAPEDLNALKRVMSAFAQRCEQDRRE